MAEGMFSVRFDQAQLSALNRRLRTLSGKLKNAQPMFRRIGRTLTGMYQRNMTSGLDPDGVPLAPVERWTRAAGVGAGAGRNLSSTVPLVNTGALRRSLGIKDIGPSFMRLGFAGTGEKKAEDQYFGRPGFMRVRAKAVPDFYSGILTADDGHDFCRVNTSEGWRTKEVIEGSFIRIKPKARRFYYLGPAQAKAAVAEAEQYVREAVRGNG